MTSLVGDLFGSVTDVSPDETISRTLLSGATSSAGAYLAAAMSATTPEVRRLFGDFLTQTMVGQQAMMDLAVKQGWVKPYDSPVQQVETAFDHSQHLIMDEVH